MVRLFKKLQDRIEAHAQSISPFVTANAQDIQPQVFVSSDTLSYEGLVKMIEDKFVLVSTHPSFKGHAEALEHLLLDLKADHMIYEARQK